MTGALWYKLVYELRRYIDNWLEIVDVNSYESHKEFMLIQQLERISTFEIKDKILDELIKLRQHPIQQKSVTNMK